MGAKRPRNKVDKVSCPVQRLVMADGSEVPTGTECAEAPLKREKNFQLPSTNYSHIGTPRYCSGFAITPVNLNESTRNETV